MRCAAALLALALFSAHAEAAEFSVLSYNVHGLSDWIVDDAPAERMPRIAERLSKYDVVLVQEDWAYHDLLVRDSGHQVVVAPNASRFAIATVLPLLQGSGLTLLARAAEDVRHRLAEALPGCSGWFSGANDCWATKGFSLARLEVAPGATVDFYTTHLDAGGGEEDQAARHAQLARFEERIRELSAGRAVIVAGDFNLHHDRPAHRAAVDGFTSALGLERSGAHGDPERWKRIDYLLYRGGSDVTLRLVEAGEAQEFRYDGDPLSDHPALYGRFEVP